MTNPATVMSACHAAPIYTDPEDGHRYCSVCDARQLEAEARAIIERTRVECATQTKRHGNVVPAHLSARELNVLCESVGVPPVPPPSAR